LTEKTICLKACPDQLKKTPQPDMILAAAFFNIMKGYDLD